VRSIAEVLTSRRQISFGSVALAPAIPSEDEYGTISHVVRVEGGYEKFLALDV
jgi:hypothetical protein